MWQDFAVAFCLMLMLEGILPFLYPERWRRLVQILAQVDNRHLRMAGFVSMLLGTGLLYLVH